PLPHRGGGAHERGGLLQRHVRRPRDSLQRPVALRRAQRATPRTTAEPRRGADDHAAILVWPADLRFSAYPRLLLASRQPDSQRTARPLLRLPPPRDPQRIVSAPLSRGGSPCKRPASVWRATNTAEQLRRSTAGCGAQALRT